MKEVDTKRGIIRIHNGHLQQTIDTVVTEFPVTVKVNGQEFVTMVCTPEHIEDMVIGYLVSEGVLKTYKDVKDIWIQEKEGFVHVKTDNINPYYQNLQNKRYITSCCGMSRQAFVFVNDALTAKKINGINIKITPDHCFRLMRELQETASTFQKTGGVHNAALCDANGILISRMDIGRHNALDKIYGYCLKNNLSTKGTIIAFSGRISSEILLKVAKIGCEIILSKSAPTEFALKSAEELGITTVGFIRNNSMNIYTRPERIANINITA
ncbi:formate dehydrogenase accessory sulfurtransferase FdhD [Heyndrickxia ginsengihumi]|uniref:formate dehydrogenase accessory sulfurtransferase FdhD n=1 Tax=Heyndrickxia ginsengihumi TaxID=363870 RepID=UPI00203F55DE|nr:formate dehydrogenase accessory sulfurtransferase FdhD [Heyndrickxia ginsengihumi]MCM3023106.1 formate dehydrogenase accessory sulfurtransferase FdhD [Heyndrickxia ginsengihumi]